MSTRLWGTVEKFKYSVLGISFPFASNSLGVSTEDAKYWIKTTNKEIVTGLHPLCANIEFFPI